MGDLENTYNFKYLHLEYLHSLSRGNLQTEVRILNVLKEDLPPLVNNLTQSIDTEDFELICNLSHKIKSSFKLIGVTRVADLLQQIEDESKNLKRTEVIIQFSDELLPVYENCIEELTILLNKYQ